MTSIKQMGLFDVPAPTICKACHRVFIVDECYPCYLARIVQEKEDAAAILRAAEADCPTGRPLCYDCKCGHPPIFVEEMKAYVCPVCGCIRA